MPMEQARGDQDALGGRWAGAETLRRFAVMPWMRLARPLDAFDVVQETQLQKLPGGWTITSGARCRFNFGLRKTCVRKPDSPADASTWTPRNAPCKEIRSPDRSCCAGRSGPGRCLAGPARGSMWSWLAGCVKGWPVADSDREVLPLRIVDGRRMTTWPGPEQSNRARSAGATRARAARAILIDAGYRGRRTDPVSELVSRLLRSLVGQIASEFTDRCRVARPPTSKITFAATRAGRLCGPGAGFDPVLHSSGQHERCGEPCGSAAGAGFDNTQWLQREDAPRISGCLLGMTTR